MYTAPPPPPPPPFSSLDGALTRAHQKLTCRAYFTQHLERHTSLEKITEVPMLHQRTSGVVQQSGRSQVRQRLHSLVRDTTINFGADRNPFIFTAWFPVDGNAALLAQAPSCLRQQRRGKGSCSTSPPAATPAASASTPATTSSQRCRCTVPASLALHTVAGALSRRCTCNRAGMLCCSYRTVAEYCELARPGVVAPPDGPRVPHLFGLGMGWSACVISKRKMSGKAPGDVVNIPSAVEQPGDARSWQRPA